MTFSNRPAPLPFFKTDFPLFLAPMAGVTDPIFRTICKELGVDVKIQREEIFNSIYSV